MLVHLLKTGKNEQKPLENRTLYVSYTATNLTHAGIERKYITESMGHSTSHSITDMYIAAYPLDTQFEYNSRLLNLGKKKDTTPTKDRIEKMTEQEAKELLLKLLDTK